MKPEYFLYALGIIAVAALTIRWLRKYDAKMAALDARTIPFALDRFGELSDAKGLITNVSVEQALEGAAEDDIVLLRHLERRIDRYGHVIETIPGGFYGAGYPSAMPTVVHIYAVSRKDLEQLAKSEAE